MFVLFLIERTLRVEMVDAAVSILPANAFALRLLMVVVVAGQVCEQVSRPASNLLSDEQRSGEDRCLLQQLVHLVHEIAHSRGVLLASAWVEYHVPLDVTSGLVVLAMADLPAEVWDQESRVAEPADGIIQRLARRKGLMTTLVRQHPETCGEKTLDERISSPETCPERQGWHVLRRAVVVEDVECRRKQGDVSCDITETSKTGSLKAVLRYGISYFLDCVIRKLELISVCINKLLFRLSLEVLYGSQRRKRR